MTLIRLTENQTEALREASRADFRTPQQMLSLLLAEAFRFYYLDYSPINPEYSQFNSEVWTTRLLAEAAEIIDVEEFLQ